MNIIQHKKEENKNVYRFSCKKCGCIFECEEDEYWEKPQVQYESSPGGACSYSYSTHKLFITCCPECHKIVEDAVYASCITTSVSNTEDFYEDNILKNAIKTNYNNKK